MTEKQITRRMTEAYQLKYGEDDNDEWYGEDTCEIWRFRRPSKNLEVKLVIDVENKRINVYEKHNNEEYHYTGNYKW